MCVKFSDLTLTFTNNISTNTLAVSTHFYVKEVGADQVGQNNERQVPESLYHWLRGGNVGNSGNVDHVLVRPVLVVGT